jgi:hypothetical protein
MEPCCEDENNRLAQEVEGRDDLVISQCQVCGRNHYELTVDTGIYDFKGLNL